jgi:hypothetical protein
MAVPSDIGSKRPTQGARILITFTISSHANEWTQPQRIKGNKDKKKDRATKV